MKVIVGRYLRQAEWHARADRLRRNEVILVSTEGFYPRDLAGLCLEEENVKFVADWYAGKYAREVMEEIKFVFMRRRTGRKNWMSKYKMIAILNRGF